MTPWLGRLGLVLLVGLSGVIGVFLANTGQWFVPSRSLSEQVDRIRPGITLLRPEGIESDVPAILFFHGCGGQRPMHYDHAAVISEAGFAVFLVDSFAPRGIGRFEALTQVCAALRLSGQERAADVFAALDIARMTPGIDSERLVLAGWSHGGWTLLDAMSYVSEGQTPPSLSTPAPSFNGVVTIIPIYPYCGRPARASGHIGAGLPAIDMILAEHDRVAPHRDCVHLAERAIAAGARLSFEIWPNVTHAFDDTDAPELDPRMDYDSDAALRLRERLIEALRQTQE